MRIMWIAAVALICTSCGPSLDDRIKELVTAKNVWVSLARERPYSYTLKLGDRPPYKVSVSNPGLLREDWLEEQKCSDVGGCRVIPTPTMRELYQLILELTGDQFQTGGDLIVVFDDEMGFPKQIFFDDHQGPHSAISLEVSNVLFAQE